MSEALGRVLVVDDDEILLGSLEQWLGLSGFSVRAAGAVDPAIVLIDQEEFDVVLTDLRMPGGAWRCAPSGSGDAGRRLRLHREAVRS